MKYKQIVLSGKVQGVFFREFVRKAATPLGLVGYVRDTRDGKVEIVVGGDEKKIEKLVSECRKGPLLADVKSVEVKDLDLDEEFDGFYVRYS